MACVFCNLQGAFRHPSRESEQANASYKLPSFPLGSLHSFRQVSMSPNERRRRTKNLRTARLTRHPFRFLPRSLGICCLDGIGAALLLCLLARCLPHQFLCLAAIQINSRTAKSSSAIGPSELEKQHIHLVPLSHLALFSRWTDLVLWTRTCRGTG